jgi:hypothetical protein
VDVATMHRASSPWTPRVRLPAACLSLARLGRAPERPAEPLPFSSLTRPLPRGCTRTHEHRHRHGRPTELPWPGHFRPLLGRLSPPSSSPTHADRPAPFQLPPTACCRRSNALPWPPLSPWPATTKQLQSNQTTAPPCPPRTAPDAPSSRPCSPPRGSTDGAAVSTPPELAGQPLWTTSHRAMTTHGCASTP